MNRGGKGGAITAYKIASNGKLTPVIGSPFDAAIIPYGISTDNGKYLYVANPAIDDNNLRVYPIRPDTGRLELEHLSTFAGMSYEAERNCCPGPMIADHDGRFVYVGNTSDKTISVYDVFPGSLALTQISKANTAPGHFPVDLAWGPGQLSLFMFTDSGLEESLLQVYRRNPQKGLLTRSRRFSVEGPLSDPDCGDRQASHSPYHFSGRVAVERLRHQQWHSTFTSCRITISSAAKTETLHHDRSPGKLLAGSG